MVLSWSGFYHTDRFHGNGHKPCIFVYDKRQIWKFAAKTAKIKPENTFILRKETTQKTDSNMDEEEYHLQSKFYYPEDLETSEAGISESQEPPRTIS